MASSEFIVEGAMAKCNQSKVPMIGTLQKPFDNQFSKTNGKTTATTMTLGPAFGVQPFGICNMIPPTPAMPTPPCVCMTIKWDEAYLEQSIGPMASHPLTKDSKATCALGGTIEFVTTGQMPKVSVVNVASLSSSSTNTISKDELDEKADFKMPENVDLTEAQQLLAHMPKISEDTNTVYVAYVAMILFDFIQKDEDHKYNKKKNKLQRDDQFNYQNEIEEFFGEYIYAKQGNKTTKEKFNTLLEFEVACITKNIKVENIGSILGELEVGTNAQIGAEWVLRDLAANAEPNSTLKFEHVVKAENGEIRRVDVRVEDQDKSKKYVEYKSVKDVPPGDFAKQFGNDLNNDEFNADQLEWRFDGDKLAQKKYSERENVTWNSLNENEKNAVRADFRKKMRNDGLNKVEMDDLYREKLMEDDDKFDELFIIA